MYVKIRNDGAIGIGRGTEGDDEITIGYGEAHMIAAALEKLAQTARSYKQTYKKTTDVGGGNKIEFERSDEGSITLSGDGNDYICTENEIRELADMLKHLPPVEAAPASDYVKKIKPRDGQCLVVTNGGNQVPFRLPEAALLKTTLISSMNGKFFLENIRVGKRSYTLERSSDLKWKLVAPNGEVRFTAYEVEAWRNGLHTGILDVLMDLVKSFGSDKLSDIRVKSQIQRIDQETGIVFKDVKRGRDLSKYIVKMSKKILGTGQDAEERTEAFIEMCNGVYAEADPEKIPRLFDLFSEIFVTAPVETAASTD